MNLDFFEEAVLDSGLAAVSGDVVDMVSLVIPYCKAAGTGQEITAPYLEVQLASGMRGACFMHRGDVKVEDLAGLVGARAVAGLKDAPHVARVALVDALSGHLPGVVGASTSTVCLTGTYAEKSLARARTLVAAMGVHASMRVGIIGAVHDIVRACIEEGAMVKVSDIGQAGTSLLDVPIVADFQSVLAESDIAFVTGNVIKTGTLQDVLTTARAHGVRLAFFAMTGANFAARYLEVGAELVSTERAPYYWYSGVPSVLDLHRQSA